MMSDRWQHVKGCEEGKYRENVWRLCQYMTFQLCVISVSVSKSDLRGSIHMHLNVMHVSLCVTVHIS